MLAAAAAVLAVLGIVLQSPWPLKLYPVLVNAALLFMFGTSLLHPPSMVERIARLGDPDLPAAAVPYTRKVTQLWCCFFVVNELVALLTALYASTRAWLIYNGFIAYVLMACVFTGEWLARRRLQRRLAADAAK